MELKKFATEEVETAKQCWLKLFTEGERLDDANLPEWMKTVEIRHAMSTPKECQVLPDMIEPLKCVPDVHSSSRNGPHCIGDSSGIRTACRANTLPTSPVLPMCTGGTTERSVLTGMGAGLSSVATQWSGTDCRFVVFIGRCYLFRRQPAGGYTRVAMHRFAGVRQGRSLRRKIR